DVGVFNDRFDVFEQQRSEVRNMRLDVFFVGPENPRVIDVSVKNLQIKTTPDQSFGQFHQRAFAQVVGASLECQAEQADLATASAGDHLVGACHLGLVTLH